MKCNCPKCHAQIEIDLPEVKQGGSATACPACKASLTAYRESFATRALCNSAEISCASCGSELGPHAFCSLCGAPFPDFILLTTGRGRARSAGKQLKEKSRSSKRGATSNVDLPSLSAAMMEDASKPQSKQTSKANSKVLLGGESGRRALIAIGLVVVIGAAGGGAFYLKKQKEEKYLKNFVLASYCIQSGEDEGLAASRRIASEWKAKADAGQPYRPRLSIEEERQQRVASSKLEGFKGNLREEPGSFGNANASLAKIDGSYAKLRSLLNAPGNSAQSFADSANKLETEYVNSAKDFKSGLPAEVMVALEDAGRQFKGLRPLLK